MVDSGKQASGLLVDRMRTEKIPQEARSKPPGAHAEICMNWFQARRVHCKAPERKEGVAKSERNPHLSRAVQANNMRGKSQKKTVEMSGGVVPYVAADGRTLGYTRSSAAVTHAEQSHGGEKP
ncbi:hypothetical protein NQZ68_036695 [Dissostichus eleginoides]|nr:hypothetical protein NQZ68_036695 [Dissostichus eleginoides]